MDLFVLRNKIEELESDFSYHGSDLREGQRLERTGINWMYLL